MPCMLVHMQDALAEVPGCLLLSYALCHACVVVGRFSSAMEAANSAAALSPLDADAAMLRCLVRQVCVGVGD